MIDICKWKIKFLWEMELAAVMVLYMLLGYLYRKYEMKFDKIFFNKKISILCVLVYLYGTLFIDNTVDIHAEKFQYPGIFVVMSIVVIIPMIKIAKINKSQKISNILTFLGKNTLFYYAFSGSVRVILYMILNQLNIIADKYIMPIVITGITVILLSVPVKFVNKYLKFVVGK